MKNNAVLCIAAVGILLCYLVACGSGENKAEKDTIALLQEKFDHKLHSSKLIIVSEQNCSSCIKSKVLLLKNGLGEGQKIMGVMYRLTRKENKDIADLKNETSDFILWKEDTDIRIMESLSRLTGKKSGPYLIEFKDGKILKADEFN